MTSQLPYRAKNDKAVGHLAALFTILVWGTTFVSTKILLVDFSPIEILFIRFRDGSSRPFPYCAKVTALDGLAA